ncbi:solute carrier family 50 (sugar transporter) [Strigomonas culicis]|uniref:Solute carrier family 50 (Sugar transporter) n=1 Tax=Strigomonas culicis TaxID=28005 RepID=S9TCP4_9TRYP|nr:solute carrier family 50 (sugar transporter) [Strigomonas culicis]|eukprot:EPY15802.1 solute carrier family 50 (sugar transporter) [Strigomonas culicis]
MAAFDVIVSLLSYTASFFSVLLNGSPIVMARAYEKNGSIGGNTNIFLGAVLFSTVTWSTYGLFKSIVPMMISNALGNAVATYSSLVFLSVARREEKIRKKLDATTYMKSLFTYFFFVFISVAHLLICVALIAAGKFSTASAFTGIEATFAGIFMISSPLLQFKHIVQTKNAASLAPLTVCFAFFNALCWTIVGVMQMDIVVFFCNFLCLLAAIAQMVLLFMYGRKEEAHEDHVAEAVVPFD